MMVHYKWNPRNSAIIVQYISVNLNFTSHTKNTGLKTVWVDLSIAKLLG